MADAQTDSMMLSGCRVLDFTQYLAGPTVTRLMAEMGADIIKVELAPMGDPSRLLPTIKNGRSGYFVQQNRGKKSICLDIKTAAGLTIVKDLLPKVDVMVESFSPGVIGRLDLDYLRAHLSHQPGQHRTREVFGEVQNREMAQHMLWFPPRHKSSSIVTPPLRIRL